MGVIYKITSPTDRLYVGKTIDLDSRIACYKHSIKKERYNTVLFNSLRKYGWEAHKIEVIEEVSDSLLEEREIFWIALLKTYCYDNPLGMNMTRGGECGAGSWMYDIERRQRQAILFTGKGNPFHGKAHSKEWRQKKSKEVSFFNKSKGLKVPQWGAEKGWEKVRKAIIVYGSDGNFIKEFTSLTDAAKTLGINRSSVSESLRYEQWCDGKYMFKHKTDNYPPTIEVGKINVRTERRPVLLLNEDYEVMADYPSSLEASVELQIPKTTINRAAMYNWMRPIRTSHIFFYKDLYEKLPEWMKNPIEN